MPQCPYIFNVYLLILTPAYNALFLVPTSRIPFLSSSCSIYIGIACYPLILVQISLFGVDCYASTIQPPMTLPVHYIHCPAFHYDPFTSLPCGKLNSSSGWGIPRRASRISLDSSRLMLAEVHAHTRPLLLYVLSMSLCRSQVRVLAVTGSGYLFFLRWLRVYLGLRFLRGIGFDWNYYNFITSHTSFPSDYARDSIRSIYCIKLI